MTALELELMEALRDYVIGDKVRGITASATHLKACAAIARAESAVSESDPIVGTKTWFDGENLITQNLTASEIYKPAAAVNEPAMKKVGWVGDCTKRTAIDHSGEKTYYNVTVYTDTPLKEGDSIYVAA